MNARNFMIAALLLLAGCMRSEDSGKLAPSCQQLCEISLLQLMAAPDQYEGKEISIVGYLGIYNHVLALYPTETQYRIIDVSSSVGFRVPAARQSTFVDSGIYRYVRVKGVFSSKFRGFDAKRLGDFVAVSALNVVTPIADADREKDFGVEAEFLDK